MKHSKQTNLLQRITACCLLTACWACSSEVTEGLQVEEGTPVKIVAEIQELTQTKTPVAENFYDRTSFITGDKIRVNRIEDNTSAQRVDYTYTAGSPGSSGTWATTADPIVLKAGSKYEATYPSDYTNILQDQSKSDGSDFLKSNLLKSGQITSRDGVLHFTGDGAFTHQNVKLTLVFKVSAGSLTGDFTTALLSAPGLINGGDKTENITLFRPDAAAYTWCGIVYPKGGSGTTNLNLQLTYQGVVYKATLSCGLAAGTHYTYTLTLKNDILVPEGSTIDDWKTDPNGDYTGGFN